MSDPETAPVVSTPSQSARVYAETLAAADAALARAAEAARAGDEAGAEAGLKLVERLAKTAATLAQAREKAPASPEDAARRDKALATEVIERISRAIEGDAGAREGEVQALISRGIDPRLGWRWDAGARAWFWEPAAALTSESTVIPQRAGTS